MAIISFYILLIFFEFSKVWGDAFSTYCALPCPFMGPAQPAGSSGAIQLPSSRYCGAIQLPPCRSRVAGRWSVNDDSESDESSEDTRSEPEPEIDPRQRPSKPSPSPKRKPKPPPKEKPAKEDTKLPPEDSKPDPEDSEPPPKRKEKPSSNSPSIQPSRRFFTSLCSIPGAIVDTLVSGEIVL